MTKVDLWRTSLPDIVILAVVRYLHSMMLTVNQLLTNSQIRSNVPISKALKKEILVQNGLIQNIF